MCKLSSYTSAENCTCTHTSKENGNQAVVCFKYNIWLKKQIQNSVHAEVKEGRQREISSISESGKRADNVCVGIAGIGISLSAMCLNALGITKMGTMPTTSYPVLSGTSTLSRDIIIILLLDSHNKEIVCKVWRQLTGVSAFHKTTWHYGVWLITEEEGQDNIDNGQDICWQNRWNCHDVDLWHRQQWSKLKHA